LSSKNEVNNKVRTWQVEEEQTLWG